MLSICGKPRSEAGPAEASELDTLSVRYVYSMCSKHEQPDY